MTSHENVWLDGLAGGAKQPDAGSPNLLATLGRNRLLAGRSGDQYAPGEEGGPLTPSDGGSRYDAPEVELIHPAVSTTSAATPMGGRWLAALDRWTAQVRLFRDAQEAYTRSVRRHGERVGSIGLGQRDVPSVFVVVPAVPPAVAEAGLGQGTPGASRLGPSPARRGGPLTAREREVAGLVARGLTNRQIADELVLESGTVANHVAHILTKLDCRNRAQVAVWAVRTGLLADGAAALAPRGGLGAV